MSSESERNAPLVGRAIPDFTLNAYDGGSGQFCQISLAEIRDSMQWCVLFFYPSDFSVLSATELADLAQVQHELNTQTCRLVAISPDTRSTHLGWLRQESLLKDVGFALASDPGGRLADSLGVLDGNTGLPLQATLLLNPDSIVLDMEISHFNVGRNGREIVRKLQAHAHLAEHPDAVCPAGWRPGCMTLAPDELMVGRVEEFLRKGKEDG